MDKTNPMWPFCGPQYGDLQTVYMATDERLNAVKRMDREALEAALFVPGSKRWG